MFRINFGSSMGAFGVPNEVVDKHIKLCGALSLKVLLVMLRLGREADTRELAATLNQTESDINDALNYWIQLGFITNDNSVMATVKENAAQKEAVQPIKMAVVQENKPELPKTILKERFYRMNRHDVNEISQKDGNIGILLEETQNILGRPISNAESETLVSLYHYYGMQLDIILMLLHYCKSIEKDTPAYIEKMGIGWINKGVDTHIKAEHELLKLTEKSQRETEIRKLFGIYDRSITPKEVEFYELWRGEFKFEEIMIKLAFEKTVDTKGKVSFSYTNAILKSWFEKGIKTPAQAEQDTKIAPTFNKNTMVKNSNTNASYDLNVLEKIINDGNIWD